MPVTYNLLAAFVFLLIGGFFTWEWLNGQADIVSRLFGPLFLIVGTARIAITVWAIRRQRAREAGDFD